MLANIIPLILLLFKGEIYIPKELRPFNLPLINNLIRRGEALLKLISPLNKG